MIRINDRVRVVSRRVPGWVGRTVRIVRGWRRGHYLVRLHDGRQDEFRRDEIEVCRG